MWLGLGLYVVVISVFIVFAYFEITPYYVRSLILPIIYLISTIILTDGLFRIKALMQRLNDKTILFSGFILHLSAFLLFLIACIIPNIVIGFRKNPNFIY